MKTRNLLAVLLGFSGVISGLALGPGKLGSTYMYTTYVATSSQLVEFAGGIPPLVGIVLVASLFLGGLFLLACNLKQPTKEHGLR